MARPKKTSPKRRQQSSTRPTRPAVVWIAPNLERITKGERGRRGLTDPSGGYYLSLADLLLKDGASKPNQPASSSLTGDEALFPGPFSATPESPSTQHPGPKQRKTSGISSSKQLKSPTVSKRPKVERPRQSSLERPKLTLPRFRPPKPPKFEPPQLPKSPRKPKPPRRRG